MSHDIKPTADLQRDRQLLLDQQDGDAAPGDLLEQAADVLHHHRGETLGRFVDHDQVRIPHQRPANRQHLLLAAGKEARPRVGALLEEREDAEHFFHRPAAADLAGLLAELQVLPHREPGKNVPGFGDVAEPPARRLMRL